MALRLKDYRCPKCGFMREEIVTVGEPVSFTHCDVESVEMPGAPMIKYVEPHFNRALGVEIKDAQHLERELKKAGSFIPTKADLEKASDTEPITELRPKADAEKIRAKAEKVWSDLHNEHKVREFPSA